MSVTNKKIISYKLVKGSIKKEDYKEYITDIYNKKVMMVKQFYKTIPQYINQN